MRSKIASVLLIIYVTVFYILFYTKTWGIIALLVFLLFPVVLLSFVLIILKDNTDKYPELGNDEWGYADKNKSEIGIL